MSQYLKADGGWGETATDLYDTANNLWVWHDATNYYLSALVGQPLSIDAVGGYVPSGYKYNAKDYRVCGSLYLWYDSTLGYVLSSYLGFGTAEYSETVDEVTTWYGDAWWSCATLTGSYIPRGSGKVTGTAKTVANASIVGLYKTVASTKIGIYTDVASPAVLPSKYVGLARYDITWEVDGEEQTGIFTQRLTDYNSKPTFSDGDGKYLWYDSESSMWIIGYVIGTVADDDYVCEEMEGSYYPVGEESELSLNYGGTLFPMTKEDLFNEKFSYKTASGYILYVWWETSTAQWCISSTRGIEPPNLRHISNTKIGTYLKDPGSNPAPAVPDTLEVVASGIRNVEYKDIVEGTETASIYYAQEAIWL